jgi:RpiB/LacA/LacB family sugar-phosphate isomerase
MPTTAGTGSEVTPFAVLNDTEKNVKGPLAISICGSGRGACITANKFKGVRAVNCESEQTGRLARVLNGADGLCMGQSVVSAELGCRMADAFIAARFQDAQGVPAKVLAFWQEARDELMARGDPAKSRDLETLP